MFGTLRTKVSLLVASFALGGGASLLYAEEAKEEAPAKPEAPAKAGATKVAPQLFDSKEAAAKALLEALDGNDDAALKAMVGTDGEDLIQSGADPIAARERKKTADLMREKLALDEMDDDGSQILVLGAKDWPMPIPLARTPEGKWFFDQAQGRDELLARRIGKNELEVMDLLRDAAEAQEAYRQVDRDGDGVLEYAQKFVSTEGERDGLYWPEDEDESTDDRSPFGALVEELEPYLKDRVKGAPFAGYVFKLLTAQGPCTPGGAYEYMVGKDLTLGFGILAVPAEHRTTGVMSFIISHRGRLFERDLGPKGKEIAEGMTVFNPDMTWKRVGDP
jgi:hypothetical protein